MRATSIEAMCELTRLLADYSESGGRGAVVCSGEGHILGIGWDAELHAEEYAIAQAADTHSGAMIGGTIYISTDLCDKCADLVRDSGIFRVVNVERWMARERSRVHGRRRVIDTVGLPGVGPGV